MQEMDRYEEKIRSLMEREDVRRILALLKERDRETLDVQMELCAIRSPSNHEEQRARRYAELLSGIGLDEVRTDEARNVIGRLRGTGDGPAVVLAAHLDTVFSADTDCTPVIKENGMVWAPGIADDTRGLAEVYMIAKTLCDAGYRPSRDILFVGDAGEESVGDLRGTRHLFASGERIGAFLSIDSSLPETLVINAIAGCTCRYTFSGKGGHALNDFGVPNVNNAMGRAAARIAELRVPEDPLTIFNIGVMRGGVSPNAIPSEAVMDVNFRSVDNAEFDRIAAYVDEAVQGAVDAENSRWAHPAERIAFRKEVLTRRPGGLQSPDLPLVRTAFAAYRAFGMEPAVTRASSTDANIPISLGIPALALGRGGRSLGIHSLAEHFDPADAYIAVQRSCVLLLAAAEE